MRAVGQSTAVERWKILASKLQNSPEMDGKLQDALGPG